MNLNVLLDTLLCLSVSKMSLKGTVEENEFDLAGRCVHGTIIHNCLCRLTAHTLPLNRHCTQLHQI